MATLAAQMVKNLPAMWETWVRSLVWEDPLEKGKGYTLQCSGLENSMDCMYRTERLSLFLPVTFLLKKNIRLFKTSL